MVELVLGSEHRKACLLCSYMGKGDMPFPQSFATYGRQESWTRGQQRRMGPAPLGSRVEPILILEVAGAGPEGVSVGEPALPLVCCGGIGEGEIPSSFLLPSPPVAGEESWP